MGYFEEHSEKYLLSPGTKLFAKGSGKISIDGMEKEIHEGEGFEILENKNISIIPKDELIYMSVIDRF